MNKENLMFGVIGLLVGLIVGFIGANSLNRSAMTQTASTSSNTAGPLGPNPALPADHPPLGGGMGDNTGAMGQPEVTAAIDKAKNEPGNFEAQMTAADLYYQIGRFDDAAKFYQAATTLRPAETEPMVKLGNALFDGDKFEEAEKWYLKALEKNPKDINVRTDLGLTYYLREPRDLDRAIKEYKAVLAIEPEHEITLQNLSLAYKDKGDTASWNETIEKLRKVNPNNPALKMAPQS